MKKLVLLFCLLSGSVSFSQNWSICNAPAFNSRVDDIFMVNAQVGYAASGDGKIVKTVDGGTNWTQIAQDGAVYFRSVEFLTEEVGFVGGFPVGRVQGTNAIILRKTIDGGNNWIDLTPSVPQKARAGICGLSVVDENIIYGCGNWYQDTGYIIKSTDGGASWGLIELPGLATSLIDLNFINKDSGFAVGKGLPPFENGVILSTTDGGISWHRVYKTDGNKQYCWKIQRLDPRNYFVSIQNVISSQPKVLRSINGGLTWSAAIVSNEFYNIQGIGYIDSLHGWTGGDVNKSYETINGGQSWTEISICPSMNRVFRVNDTIVFATGAQIWKYNKLGIITSVPVVPPVIRFVSLKCYPNPVNDILKVDITIKVSTHVSLVLLDASGKQIKVIDNTDRVKGAYKFKVNTADIPAGLYYVSLMTHEDKTAQAIIVSQ